MKIFFVEYIINNVDCIMAIQAKNLTIATNNVEQWKQTKLRYTNNKIKIISIIEVKNPENVLTSDNWKIVDLTA